MDPAIEPDHVNSAVRGVQNGEGLHDRVALVTGASGGIGLALVDQLLAAGDCSVVFAACRRPELSPALLERMEENPRLQLLTLDVTDSDSVRAAVSTISLCERVDLVINTAGVLHTADGMRPEKRLKDINFDDLMLAYDVNALGMMRLATELEPLLRASRSPRFVTLSARVGSIADNRLGGWYSYRASKAALNMLLRTLSIEWARTMPNLVCVALHPGTVSTALSAPYTKGRNGMRLFTPAEAAEKLLDVLEELGPGDSGGFFAWDGSEVPW